MTFKACALWRFSLTPQNDSGDFIYLLVAPDLEYSPLERGGAAPGRYSRNSSLKALRVAFLHTTIRKPISAILHTFQCGRADGVGRSWTYYWSRRCFADCLQPHKMWAFIFGSSLHFWPSLVLYEQSPAVCRWLTMTYDSYQTVVLQLSLNQLPSVLRFLKHPQSYPEPRLV